MRSFALLSIVALTLTAGCGKEAASVTPRSSAAAENSRQGPTAAKPVAAAPEVGQTAPDFELSDLDGRKTKLSDHRGKVVVLEWYNPDCPFVRAAHNTGPLKDMAAEQVKRGLVWLAINSGAPGKQGHGVERNRRSRDEYKLSHPILVDEDGQVGRRYGAITTPQMFVIGRDGKLLYQGALDNAPLGEPKGGQYKPYLADALTDVAADRPVRVARTKPWGCSVKYAK